jgi:hypothetical protein
MAFSMLSPPVKQLKKYGTLAAYSNSHFSNCQFGIALVVA